MTGATGNYYCGLHEFEDMAFVVNLLRPDDQFVDVGANIGSYTILASGHAGAESIAIEPLPKTFDRLQANVMYNKLERLVSLHNCGVGDTDTTLRFTSDLDTTNHVATAQDSTLETTEVPVYRIDALLGSVDPLCIKVDVEGFEHQVLEGGSMTLQKSSLRAVLIELNQSGHRYGHKDSAIHQKMIDFGFEPFDFDPLTRVLEPRQGRNRTSGNTLYLRDVEYVRQRVSDAAEIELPWRVVST